MNSNGHVGWSNGLEYYVVNGDVYRAPESNVMDIDTGSRIGRWECPVEHYRHFWEAVYKPLGLPQIEGE